MTPIFFQGKIAGIILFVLNDMFEFFSSLEEFFSKVLC